MLITLTTGLLLPALVGCGGGNEWGWRDAGDYSREGREVDAQGRSLVAEEVITEWAEENLEPDLGEPLRVEGPRHTAMVDDFGDTYEVQVATMEFWYPMSLEELHDRAEALGGTSVESRDCGEPLPGERRRTGEVRWCLMEAATSPEDLPKPVTLDVWWHEYEDGRTEAELVFEYDPRDE